MSSSEQCFGRLLAGFSVAVLVAAGLAIASPATAAPTTIGAITGFRADGATYTITADSAAVRVIFSDADLFRIWLAPNGTFTDPANTPPTNPNNPRANIVVKTNYPAPQTSWADRGAYYEISTARARLRATKNPLRFSLFASDGRQIWAETRGLTWDTNGTAQTLGRGAQEQFLGGGMQNGRFSHRGTTIQVARNFNWEDGGNPNSSPFYLSTAGYGVLRNTFSPGSYAFTDPVSTTHTEQRFDAYYFVGDLKQALDGYTELTGRPFLPPIYGLELGDADCYNRSNPDYQGTRDPNKLRTPDAIRVAQGYVDNDMPRGWMLVNDGYGCGYQELERTGTELRARKVDMGLWTQAALTNQEFEVRNAGVRVRKLDVAWVGPGYRHALSACEDAYSGIERFSDARGYAWMVEGWAGAQRCAVQWTGDHSGSLGAIRWQVPAVHGSGNSGIAWTAGDIDGIFGGSAQSYVRDLQWKAFSPVLMSMSGWAAVDKQPWRYGEPYTSINRDYLRLRERLLPYFYSYAAEAHRTGVPPVRSMVLEYPGDPVTWGNQTTQQFMAGEWFLVAPVSDARSVRDGIYLPAGRWVDYWSGTVYRGGQTRNGYGAPLSRLPLFAKAGAIVPMWPAGINNHRDVRPADRLTLDVYPSGSTSFTLYEDDGVTRQYAQGRFASQTITSRAPVSGAGDVELTVGASVGSFTGKAASRPYAFTVHTGSRPVGVTLNQSALRAVGSKAELDAASSGWFYDASDRGGIVHVKTAGLATDAAFTVRLTGTSAVGGPSVDSGVPAVEFGISPQADPVEAGGSTTVTSVVVNRDDRTITDVSTGLTAPAGWQVQPVGSPTVARLDPGQSATVRFTVTPPSGVPMGVYDVQGSASYQAGSVFSLSHTGVIQSLPRPPVADTWASDLDWMESTNGWGPAERDRSNGESAAGDGGPLLLDGTSYTKGIGSHAASKIRIYTGGRCTRFTAKVGVDDSRAETGSVTFEVWADSAKVYGSALVRRSTPTIGVTAAITGARFVDLVVTDGGDGRNADHGNWAEARLACSG